MNTYSLPPRPLLQDDIEKLTELFILTFDYFLDKNSPYQRDHLRALRTIIGLGFTASLVDGDLLYIYKNYLNQFLIHEGNYKNHPEAKFVAIAQATANMIGTAAISFSALRCPRYYEDFIGALSFILTQWTDHKDEVESILSKLRVQKSMCV